MHSLALRYLDQVARHGSIRKAADALNVSSSGVNRLILKLEQDLGTSLFERHRRGVTPTRGGERLLGHARDTLAEFQRAKSDIASLSGVLSGEVRIISVPSLLIRFIPQVLADVSARHPSITFHVTEANPTAITKDIQAARHDIGLVLVDKRHRDIQVVAQAPAPIGVVVRPDHPLARQARVSIEDCAAFPLVLLEDMWILNPMIEQALAEKSGRMAPRLVSNSAELNYRLVKIGYGIGFSTAIHYVDEIRRGELVHLPLSDASFAATSIGIVVPHAARVSPPAQIVLAAMTRQLPKLLSDLAAPSRSRPAKASRRATVRGPQKPKKMRR